MYGYVKVLAKTVAGAANAVYDSPMAKDDSSTPNTKTVERVQNLLAKAQDDSATEEEARTSALLAVRLMRDHDLQVVSGSELEKMQLVVSESREIAAAAKAESRKNMVVGGILGYVLGGGKKLF